MSWLFGKKKHHKESPPDTSEEEQLPPEQGDDFIFVEKRNPASPDNREAPANPAGGLYPSLSGVTSYTTVLPSQKGVNQQADYVHYLSGVPFKFCKQLEHIINNDADIDKLRVNEILSFIERIENEDYDYDFSIEQAVIAEMNSTNECDQEE